MVKINRIYTRTGDDGMTGLVGGARVPKDSLRVEAYGAVDELNSFLGMTRTVAEPESTRLARMCAWLQNVLFDIGAQLATPPGEGWEGMKVIEPVHTSRVERWIDELTTGIPELRSFVLPGGTALNAWLHLARTSCRRAEREVLRLSRNEEVPPEILKFLNRLSDLLFAMSRSASHEAGVPEYLWVPGKDFEE
jgi:cob(I)alamin adenosyltransferase